MAVAVAESARLTVADLPAGWTAEPHTPSSTVTSSPALDARIANCIGVEVSLTNADLQPHADAQDLFGPAGQKVESGVAVFGNASLATRWIQVWATAKARACLASSLGASAKVPLRATPIALARVGDGVVGVRIRTTNTGGDLVFDTIFARRGRALVYLTVLTPTGVDAAALLAKTIGRLPATP